MSKPQVLVLDWLPDGMFAQLAHHWPSMEWVDGRSPASFEQHHATATITYGLPPVARLEEMAALKWVQLVSAGVPQVFCPVALRRNLIVTNLSGLYGPTIAEHALAMLTFLARNLHTVVRNQLQAKWDRSVMDRLTDLRGKTLAVIGLGDIGQAIARLAKAFGMRVIGCRRTDRPVPGVDRVFPLAALHAMLTEADHLAVAAPLTALTQGMFGPAEFDALRSGAIYINVSRGAIAQEAALLAALQSGKVAAAGLDVFATEPLLANHPFWSLPQVLVSPHYSGETVNQSAQPAARFERNLAAWSTGRELEGLVDLQWGY
jgi:phosphoglycerate dehydrogenase-like enzyme